MKRGWPSSRPSRKNRSRPRQPPLPSIENALALFVDDLTALGERYLDRIVEPGKAVGADEFVLLDHAADLLRDRAGSLVLPVALIGRGANDEALVLDLLGHGGRLRLAAATAEQTLQERHFFITL